MSKITVTIEVDVPDEGATPQQIVQWAEFAVGFTGGLSCANPLVDHDLSATSCIVDHA